MPPLDIILQVLWDHLTSRQSEFTSVNLNIKLFLKLNFFLEIKIEIFSSYFQVIFLHPRVSAPTLQALA